jgi:hypothetical protein
MDKVRESEVSVATELLIVRSFGLVIRVFHEVGTPVLRLRL